jgi:hypothetical protein
MAKKKRRDKQPAIVRTVKRSSGRFVFARNFKCPGDCKSLTVVPGAHSATPKSLTVFI